MRAAGNGHSAKGLHAARIAFATCGFDLLGLQKLQQVCATWDLAATSLMKNFFDAQLLLPTSAVCCGPDRAQTGSVHSARQ
jgi:hypothetical protein